MRAGVRLLSETPITTFDGIVAQPRRRRDWTSIVSGRRSRSGEVRSIGWAWVARMYRVAFPSWAT